MRKALILILLCLCIAGCSREPNPVPTTHDAPPETTAPIETTVTPPDYSFSYRDAYLTLADSAVFYEWYREAAQNSAELPVLILQSTEDADALMDTLREKHSAEAAAQVEALLEETRQLFWVEELFQEWSVAMILCREENGAVQHIVKGAVNEDIYTLSVLRICGEEERTAKLRLIPVWIPKVRLVNYQAVEAVWGETLSRRYPLAVTLSEDTCKSVITEGAWADVLDYEIYYRDVTRVEIDFAGESMELQAALETGKITMEELLLRAQIDADSGLCRWDEYNDGGTTVYRYPEYRIYKLKRGGVPGNVVITGPDVQLDDFS